MNKDNIIFLDIDGVLNTNTTLLRTPHSNLDPICVEFLISALQNIPYIKLVISSCWRIGSKDVRQFCKYLRSHKVYTKFKPLLDYLHPDYCTPSINRKGRIRGEEIEEWLNKHLHDVDKYLCIDDSSDYLEYQPLLQIDNRVGISSTESELIKNYFGIWDCVDIEQQINFKLKSIDYEKQRLERKANLIQNLAREEVEKCT